jgi:hypothetical protein
MNADDENYVAQAIRDRFSGKGRGKPIQYATRQDFTELRDLVVKVLAAKQDPDSEDEDKVSQEKPAPERAALDKEEGHAKPEGWDGEDPSKYPGPEGALIRARRRSNLPPGYTASADVPEGEGGRAAEMKAADTRSPSDASDGTSSDHRFSSTEKPGFGISGFTRCQQCGRVFQDHMRYDAHLRSHTREDIENPSRSEVATSRRPSVAVVSKSHKQLADLIQEVAGKRGELASVREALGLRKDSPRDPAVAESSQRWVQTRRRKA